MQANTYTSSAVQLKEDYVELIGKMVYSIIYDAVLIITVIMIIHVIHVDVKS